MTPRVYLSGAGEQDSHLLEQAKSRHLLKVLRLRQGAPLILFDGDGNTYTAIVGDTDKQCLRVHIQRQLPPLAADGGVSIHIGQAICAAPKMDWLVEKSTELGATTITPLLSATSAAAPRRAQLERWQRLTAAACEQCGRARLPPINPPSSPASWNATLSATTTKILLSPRAQQPLAVVVRRLPNPMTPMAVAVGAEAGFTAKEENQMEEDNFLKAHLGARTLRAETAAMAALSLIRGLEDEIAAASR